MINSLILLFLSKIFNLMKKNIVLILVMLSLVFCKTNSINKKSIIKTPTILKADFPKDWTGNYAGELKVYGVDSIRMTAKMKLIIAKKTDSLYNWTINYNINGKEDIRAYELLIVDSKKGHYVIDEKNSIKIDAFYHNRIFTSFFKVMNSYIVASKKKQLRAIHFKREIVYLK